MTVLFRPSRLWVVSLLITAMLLPGCGDRLQTGLSVELDNPETELGPDDLLTVSFNDDLISEDSLPGRWHTGEYLSFDPPVAGRYQWTDSRQLVFAPEGGWPLATDYTVKAGDVLLEKSPEFDRFKGKSTFPLKTLELRVLSAFTSWAQGDDGSPDLQVYLEFNSSVDALDAACLEFSEGSQVFPHEAIGEISGNLHKYRVRADKPASLTITVPDGCPHVRKKAATNIPVTPVDDLRILNAQAVSDAPVPYFAVFTSQKVSAEAIRKFVSLDPEQDFELQETLYGFDLVPSEFRTGAEYFITCMKGMPGTLAGAVLPEDYGTSLSFGEPDPRISFDHESARYLSTRGSKAISCLITGIPEVELSVYKVFENNLVRFLEHGMRWDYEYVWDEETGDGNYYDYQYYDIGGSGQLVHSETIKTAHLPQRGLSRLLTMDFTDKLAGFQGIYVVRLAHPETSYLSDWIIVSLSDIGLLAKSGKDHFYVFASQIHSARPAANTEVRLISEHNQVMATRRTGPDGVAKFSKQEFPEGFEPRLVVAAREGDYNYLALNASEVMTARYDVGGKRLNDLPYDVFLYAERDLYRPGETMNLAGMLRETDGGPAPSMPLRIVLKDPRGREYAVVRAQTDGQGMFTAAFPTTAASPTGNYAAEVYSGSDTYLGLLAFHLEEFLPDRIRVKLALSADSYRLEDTIRASLLAENYFGPPAADRTYEAELSLEPASFSPPGFDRFSFELANPPKTEKMRRNGKTGKDGTASLDFAGIRSAEHTGLLRASLHATVFDETGRPVHQKAESPVYTQEVFLGMGETDYWYATNQPVTVPLVAVDVQGRQAGQQAEVEVVHFEWRSVLRTVNGQNRYVSEKSVITSDKRVVNLSGATYPYRFTPKIQGGYEIRVRIPGSPTYVARQFYAWNDQGGGARSGMEVDREGRIAIELDKDTYKPGETATALFKLPFTGRLLLTIERGDVTHYETLDATDRQVRHSFRLSEGHVPTTYITATLTRPHVESGMPLTVAYGFQPVTVEPLNGKLPIAIEAADKSRSETRQRITLRTEPNAHLSVAVVDEGILGLTGMQSPDPYGHYYGKQALEVAAYSMYPFLFPEVTATGGDNAAAAALDLRINPVKNERVKLVSFWSGIIKADGSGQAVFEVDIPRFSGKLRLMATGCLERKFGSAEAHMTVADPIVVSAAVPRFLSMGDQWDMKVSLANTTGKPLIGNLSVKTGELLQVTEADRTDITVPANSEATATFLVKAGSSMGNATVDVVFNAPGGPFRQSIALPVRPSASLTKSNESGSLEGGKSVRLQPEEGWVPGTLSRRIFLSRSPLGRFAGKLNDLLGYPYGCVEQSLSKAFPQLYFEDLSQAISARGATEASLNEIRRNVQETVSKIRTVQTPGGGLSYWPGSSHISWWSSAYAAHFLLEARRQGFVVDQAVLDKLLLYLKQNLNSKGTVTYRFNDGMQREIVPKETAYSLFVLALAGKPERSAMRHYLLRPKDLSLDSRYLVAAAFLMTGDSKSAAKLLPERFEGERSETALSGSFHSYVRDMAITAVALMQADPQHPQLPGIIAMLTEEMASARYLNTQELAFGFLALGKYAQANPAGNAQATLSANGKQLASFTGKGGWYDLPDGADEVVLEASGKGRVYYDLHTQGIPLQAGSETIDNLLQVRRTYLDRNGKGVNQYRFNAHELLVVRIDLQSLTGQNVQNVVVTDLLPAGMEIENTRITDLPGMNWMTNNDKPDYMDVRDDRINFFLTATPEGKSLYYLVRTVSPGTFIQGPVSADAMYDGRYRSYSGSGKVYIK